MDKDKEKIKKVNIRNSINFSISITQEIVESYSKDGITPSKWPKKIPLTIKQICDRPEINNDKKLAKKIMDTSIKIWIDMRKNAIMVEKDMELHPENYNDDLGYELGPDFDFKAYLKDNAWRVLSIEIEKMAGSLFITEFNNEENARKNVYKLIGAKQLKIYILEFEDDYKNFIDEVREFIRNKIELPSSVKFELICLLHSNTEAAKKLILKIKKSYSINKSK